MQVIIPFELMLGSVYKFPRCMLMKRQRFQFRKHTIPYFAKTNPNQYNTLSYIHLLTGFTFTNTTQDGYH